MTICFQLIGVHLTAGLRQSAPLSCRFVSVFPVAFCATSAAGVMAALLLGLFEAELQEGRWPWPCSSRWVLALAESRRHPNPSA